MTRRIGILTLPLHNNYGGILQASALYEYMVSAGYETTLLERKPRKSIKGRIAQFIAGFLPEKFLDAGKYLFNNEKLLELKIISSNNRFIKQFIPRTSGSLFTTINLHRAINKLGIEAVIVGSDQVWRPDYLPPNSLGDYFLGFVEGTSARRISYAASFGHGDWRHPEHTSEVSTLLSRFDAVSVREASGLDICDDMFGRRDAVHVLDPTLLVDPAFYDRVADARSVKTNPVLFEYILDYDGAVPKIGQKVAEILWTRYSVQSVALDSKETMLGIGGWVRSIMDADFVVTDSFHGMVFSIIFQKNFIALVNHKRGADRFASLAGMLGLDDRLIYGASWSQAREIATRPIDYSAVSVRLEALRERSRVFLRNALGSSRA